MKVDRLGETKPRKSRSGGLTGVPARKASSAQKVEERFDFEVGERIGESLVVTAHISWGPYTDIYRVWSAGCMCTYACKLLKRHVSEESPEARALVREHQILRGLAHPNIVRVYPSDPSVEQPHLLMDYLSGPTLLDILGRSPRRRLPVDEVVRRAVQIGGAVAHLHEKGYLYRDLKPANLLDRDGSPVLIDLGSAYRYRTGRAPRVRAGTDPYMAPEQCLGEPLSPATDVYGLGAVVYEMLTGEWPFEDQLMSVFDRKRLENRFPQIKHELKPLRRKLPSVDRALADIVERCLARDPAARFATVSEAVTALGAFVPEFARVLLRAPAA